MDKDLNKIVLDAIKRNKTKLSDKEFLFVFPMVGQVTAANRAIDILIEKKEPACLGLICRQIFEILVSLEFVFSSFHLDHETFPDFCEYFTKHGRIGRYSRRQKEWVDASIDSLCDNYIKHSENQMVKECYDALCQMTHFSLMHTKETLLINGDILEVNLSGIREESDEICDLANTARAELVRLISEAIRREYLVNTPK